MSDNQENFRGEILIVDDVPDNVRLLSGMLKEQGYRIRAAINGIHALGAAVASRPDIVLLDISMPGMNGYDVCIQFKKNPDLADIPVIFISAASETIDKVRAFGAGGVDFITKPFQCEEVVVRIETHLSILRQRRDLEEKNRQLAELETMRDGLMHMIVHDLRSPLQAISGYVELVEAFQNNLDSDQQDYFRNLTFSIDSLLGLVTQLLDLGRLENGSMPLNPSHNDLAAMAQSIIDQYKILAENRHISLISAPAVTCMCDYDLVRRVIANLVTNAIKFTPKMGSITIVITTTETAVEIRIADTGPGIPEESRERIFEKFGQLDRKQARTGSGIGLTFCKLAVERHGGTIHVESGSTTGSIFVVRIPLSIGNDHV